MLLELLKEPNFLDARILSQKFDLWPGRCICPAFSQAWTKLFTNFCPLTTFEQWHCSKIMPRLEQGVSSLQITHTTLK
jgi:hypothetical protein